MFFFVVYSPLFFASARFICRTDRLICQLIAEAQIRADAIKIIGSVSSALKKHFSLRCQRKTLAKRKAIKGKYPFENPRQKAEQLRSISAPKSKVQVYPDATLAEVIILSARTSLQLLRSSPVKHDRAVKPCCTLTGVVSDNYLYPRAYMNGTVC